MSASGLLINEYGVALGLSSDDPELLERVIPWVFLPGWAVHPLAGEVETIALRSPTPGDPMFRATFGEEQTSARIEEEFAEAVGRMLHLRLATLSPLVFVHAGVVVAGSSAIVLPGRSFGGKSTLVKALVEQGAHYYSDEYAVLDEEGWVYPFPRPLMLRQPERHSLRLASTGPARSRVGLVASILHRPGARLELREMTAGECSLAMFSNTVSARRLGARALEVLARVAGQASVRLAGLRGEAQEAASELLARQQV